MRIGDLRGRALKIAVRIMVMLLILLSFSVVQAQAESSYIIVHALNPEGVEIGSMQQMDEVQIYDSDTLIGYADLNIPPSGVMPPYSPPIGYHWVWRQIGSYQDLGADSFEGYYSNYDIPSGAWNGWTEADFIAEVEVVRGKARANAQIVHAGPNNYQRVNEYSYVGTLYGNREQSSFCDWTVKHFAVQNLETPNPPYTIDIIPVQTVSGLSYFTDWINGQSLVPIINTNYMGTFVEENPGGYNEHYIGGNGRTFVIPYTPTFDIVTTANVDLPVAISYYGGRDLAAHTKYKYYTWTYRYTGGSVMGWVLTKKSPEEVNELPVASFTYSPEKLHVSEELIFDASSSYDPDGSIASYNWNFGDGNSTEGKVVNHTYANAGNYTVVLTLTDNNGLTNTSELNLGVKPIPVILVHGWRGSPETWSMLRQKLDVEGIDYYIFDYSPATGDPRDYAIKLKEWIEKLRTDTGYKGKFDIVVHSMGALVSRWYIEELGGAKNIRQWIGIAPVNHGAALADLEGLIPLVVHSVLSWFFPDLSIPKGAIVQMKNESSTVIELNKDGIDPNVIYKVIVGYNPNKISSFGGLFDGKTRVKKIDDKGKSYYYFTYQGDGVVAMEQSKLGGAGTDCYPDLTHTSIYRDDAVGGKIIEYLLDPSIKSSNNCPTADLENDHYVTGIGNKGILYKGEYKPIKFSVDSSVKKVVALTQWSGSDMNLTLISPSGSVMKPGIYPVIEYSKEGNSIWKVVDLPEQGNWTARIDAIDVPEEGEQYTFTIFYSSPLTLELTTAEDKYSYDTGEKAKIVAKIAKENIPITEATVTAKIERPDELTDEFVLYDDGTHGDALANDGNYTNIYSLSMSGDYGVTVLASGVVNEAFERTEFMTLGVVSTTITATPTPIQTTGVAKGDVSGDGQVTVVDALFVAQYTVGLRSLNSQQLAAADVNGDGQVTVVDALFIAQYTVGLRQL